jgi:hypothetical protein
MVLVVFSKEKYFVALMEEVTYENGVFFLYKITNYSLSLGCFFGAVLCFLLFSAYSFSVQYLLAFSMTVELYQLLCAK